MDEVCTKGIVPYATQRPTGLHHYDYLRETDAAVLGVTVVGRDLVGTTKRILGASANLTGGGSTPPSRWRRLRGFRSGRFCVFDESVAAVAAAVENDEEALTSPDPTCRTQGYLPQAKQATAASKNSSNSQNKTKKTPGTTTKPQPPKPAWADLPRATIPRVGRERGLGVATLNLHMAQFQQRHRREEQARQHVPCRFDDRPHNDAVLDLLARHRARHRPRPRRLGPVGQDRQPPCRARRAPGDSCSRICGRPRPRSRLSPKGPGLSLGAGPG
ncbi:hypothetical protein MCOR27_004085 [Pyricularia oryzae]|nr:hypothetical protein MCOR27_004085 [Pyricularia oryzae]KAI6449260.1 hypothetical protein MCOR22_002409 [Pyricularia oryzae]